MVQFSTDTTFEQLLTELLDAYPSLNRCAFELSRTCDDGKVKRIALVRTLSDIFALAAQILPILPVTSAELMHDIGLEGRLLILDVKSGDK